MEIRPLNRHVESEWARAVSPPLPCHPFLALLLLQHPQPFFIQIGAHDGISFDDLFGVVRRHQLPGLVVEPLPDLFEKLRENYTSHPQVTPVNVAIDVHPGRRTMYRVPSGAPGAPSFASGIGSFDPRHHRRSGVSTQLICEQTVECITFDELMERYKVERVDYLQVDTEGYDAQILNSIDITRIRPGVIRFEHSALSPGEKDGLANRLAECSYQLIADQENAFAVSQSLLGADESTI